MIEFIENLIATCLTVDINSDIYTILNKYSLLEIFKFEPFKVFFTSMSV